MVVTVRLSQRWLTYLEFLPSQISHHKHNDDHAHLKHGLHFKTIFGSDHNGHPMSCGMFSITDGEPTLWTNPCPEFIFSVEGAYS